MIYLVFLSYDIKLALVFKSKKKEKAVGSVSFFPRVSFVICKVMLNHLNEFYQTIHIMVLTCLPMLIAVHF